MDCMHKHCKDCGEPYGYSLFLWLSDTLWEKINCNKTDYFCSHCILDRLEKKCMFIYAIEGTGQHTIQEAGATIIMNQDQR